MKKPHYTFLRHTTTTQDDAYRLFLDTFPNSTASIAVVSETMTNGRGRVGRQWFADMSGNLNISIAFSHSFLLSKGVPLTILPIVVVVSVAKALGLHDFAGFKHKWPNDILINNKKAGGVLIEIKDGVCVVGIGANIYFAPVVSDVETTSLFDNGLVAGLLPNYDTLGQKDAVEHIAKLVGDTVWLDIQNVNNPLTGYASSIGLWAKHSWKRYGDSLEVKLPDGSKVACIYQGINADGTLAVVELNGGLSRSLSYGDVS